MSPASGLSNPQIMRSVVVFPAPSGPMTPNISPGATSNETPATAVVRPKDFRTPFNDSAGEAGAEL
jgi:hypothetical protein